eukprot:CAMPEP_0194554074 /NCGR_PEP_ID=MMETSP0253-20130528/97550_1 /TAXON_ID=2966 /ORGANISM="Noctiluca scintillans" /LENGTH=100 /DNA_ID=CAMNT_0039401559 /DNA_START=430 /DNA_END=732 /DNA_ORIENTATION=-
MTIKDRAETMAEAHSASKRQQRFRHRNDQATQSRLMLTFRNVPKCRLWKYISNTATQYRRISQTMMGRVMKTNMISFGPYLAATGSTPLASSVSPMIVPV